jgi:hypothetical protein
MYCMYACMSVCVYVYMYVYMCVYVRLFSVHSKFVSRFEQRTLLRKKSLANIDYFIEYKQ